MIVFVLRHADRSAADGLSPAGIERAELLARMLADSGIRTAYCSDALRTQQTAEPLKRRLGANLQVVTVDGAGDHVQKIMDSVKALPDDAVTAIIGHSNTVGPIIQGLTGRPVDEIKDHEFDRLFVVSISAGSSTVAPMRYGKPT